jgi:EmrB/QacA subfamily drug resistance transporter
MQLDVTIVNVALPSIGRDLHAPVSGLQWTIDAYTLVIASLLMLAGSTADRLGRRKVFRVGLCVFTLASAACSLAPSLTWLVTFRIVQAVGASMLNPVAVSIIRNTFGDPRERAHAIGIWGAVNGIAMAVGPVLGGVLVQNVGWRSIFWVNIPVGIAAVLLTTLFVPESKAPAGRRNDPLGQVLVTVMLASLTYAIIEGPAHRWSSTEIGGFFALALVSCVLFVLAERRRRQPLIEMRFFRSVPFSSATVVAVVSFFAFAGFLFLNTLYLQDVRGLSALRTGLDTLPMAAAIAIASSISGRLVGRLGTRPSLALAGTCMAAASLLLTRLSPTTSFTLLFVTYTVFGVGFGAVNAPITNTAVSGMPSSQAGVAAAIASTSRQVGQTLGVAIVGSVTAGGLVGGMVTRHFADATHFCWWIIAGCGVMVLLLGLFSNTSWARATAGRAAARLEVDERSAMS